MVSIRRKWDSGRRREIQEQTEKLFEQKRGLKKAQGPGQPEQLYGEIGRLKVELDWLKKQVRAEPVTARRGWIERGGEPTMSAGGG